MRKYAYHLVEFANEWSEIVSPIHRHGHPLYASVFRTHSPGHSVSGWKRKKESEWRTYIINGFIFIHRHTRCRHILGLILIFDWHTVTVAITFHVDSSFGGYWILYFLFCFARLCVQREYWEICTTIRVLSLCHHFRYLIHCTLCYDINIDFMLTFLRFCMPFENNICADFSDCTKRLHKSSKKGVNLLLQKSKLIENNDQNPKN